jgi:hypothetical protein
MKKRHTISATTIVRIRHRETFLIGSPELIYFACSGGTVNILLLRLLAPYSGDLHISACTGVHLLSSWRTAFIAWLFLTSRWGCGHPSADIPHLSITINTEIRTQLFVTAQDTIEAEVYLSTFRFFRSYENFFGVGLEVVDELGTFGELDSQCSAMAHPADAGDRDKTPGFVFLKQEVLIDFAVLVIKRTPDVYMLIHTEGDLFASGVPGKISTPEIQWFLKGRDLVPIRDIENLYAKTVIGAPNDAF